MTTHSRPSTAAPILTVVAILLLPLVAHVAGCFVMGKRGDWTGPPGIVRIYPFQWQMRVFEPAGKVESVARGIEVEITCVDVPEIEKCFGDSSVASPIGYTPTA